MVRLTSDWTERHLQWALAMFAATAAGSVAMLADAPYHLVGVAAVITTVCIALRLDAFGGILAGFAGAAVVIGVEKGGGDWTPKVFGAALALTACLVVVGWLTGSASAGLRRPAPESDATTTLTPAFGSLGLLTPELAMARLDEEVTRARLYRRPLTLVLVRTEITDPDLPLDALSHAHRTVARLVESLVPESAVPFALAPDQVGAVLPETDAARAWGLLGPIVDAAYGASFSVRDGGDRRSLVACAEVHAGLAEISVELPDADRLVAAVRAMVQPKVTVPPSDIQLT